MFHTMRVLLLLCFCISPAEANPVKGPERGVWFWQGTLGDTHGSIEVVGDAVKEDAMITFLKAHKISKVYGSYGNRPATPTGAAEIAIWNSKLHAEGMESQILMSETSWIFPDKHPNLLAALADRLVNFNAGRPASEQFDGLHFDVEPQSYKDSHDGIDNDNGWPDITSSEKRDYVVMLGGMYGVARAFLDSAIGPGFPVWGDIPVWYDNLTESIAWTDAAERDLWFSEAASNLTGFVMMAFEITDFPTIESRTDWERTNISGALLRYALRVKVGTGTTNDWPTMGHFFAMRNQVEDAYGHDKAVDIQDYADYRANTVFLPGVAAPAVIAPPIGILPWIIEVDAEPQFVYFIYQSADLCRWKLVTSFEPASARMQRLNIDTGGAPRSFIYAVRYPSPAP
jgi:hypothetical protein